jgi:hypothetical protein
VTYLNEYYRERLRSLRAVDELVEGVGKKQRLLTNDRLAASS